MEQEEKMAQVVEKVTKEQSVSQKSKRISWGKQHLILHLIESYAYVGVVESLGLIRLIRNIVINVKLKNEEEQNGFRTGDRKTSRCAREDRG